MKKALLCLLMAGFMCTGFLGKDLASAADLRGDDRLANEIRMLAAAIDRLAALYEEGKRQAEQDALSHKLDTAIAYLNFRSRRIELLEQDLQELKISRDRLDTFLIQIVEKENLLEAQARNSTIGSTAEIEKARKEHDLRVKMVQERLDRVDRETIILENKIQELQDEISSVESFVQRNLEF